MAQHFLLSKAAKTLSLASVFTMKDADAETAFRRIRWADTNGDPVCPHCGGVDAYDCRRLKGAPRFRCRACVKDFTITSGTLFASHKLPLRLVRPLSPLAQRRRLARLWRLRLSVPLRALCPPAI
jgi:transposase-like protein